MDFRLVRVLIRLISLGGQFLIAGLLIADTVLMQRKMRTMRRR